MQFFFGVSAQAAGAAAAVQSAANGGLAQRIGLGGALVINTSIVLAGSVALWLATGARTALFQTGTPAVFYLGGVFGFVIIAGMASSLPRLGAGAAVSLMVLGMGLAALAIDHFALFGAERQPATLARLAGVALLAVGVALLRA